MAVDWSALAPDKASPVPRYAQLAAAIRERIRAGALPPGAQLPPERELAEAAGISRMTARQALADLVRDGSIEVRHGVGAFVAAPKLTYDALHLLGFTEEVRRMGGEPSARVLEQAVVVPAPAVAAALAVEPGELAVKIVRLRLASGVPLLLETSHLPWDRCRGLEAEDLGRGSLYALLEERYGLSLVLARQTIEAAVAAPREGALLGVAAGAPVLRAEGVAVGDGDRPIEAFTAIYRADRIRFGIESRREGAPARELSLVVT